jgi:hypothetical protein
LHDPVTIVRGSWSAARRWWSALRSRLPDTGPATTAEPDAAATDRRFDGDEIDLAQLRAGQSQSTSSWISAGATVVALGISSWALVSQVQLNEQQKRLNTFAQERQQRRDSSRVALWAIAGSTHSSTLPSGLDVSLQNRSPVPLRGVRLHARIKGSTGPAGVRLMDVPPCTIQVYRVAPPAGSHFDVPADAGGDPALTLEFTVDQQQWQLTFALLRPMDAWTLTAKPPLRALLLRKVEAADCGEGG